MGLFFLPMFEAMRYVQECYLSCANRRVLAEGVRDSPVTQAAAKIAAALGVSLDYLAGLSDNQVDAATLNKIIEIQALADVDRKHIMTTIDALLRDAKARKAYA